jgi:hypothetical protein
MPVWAAIIVGLGSGLAGSIVSTLLTISHERGAEFRGRMLQAAEDFLRQAETTRRAARRPRGTGAGPLGALLDAWDELVSAVVLVELLFGHDSEAAYWARETSNELKDVEDELRTALGEQPGLTVPTRELAISGHMQAAGQAMQRFGAVAAAQLRHQRTLTPLRPRRARDAGELARRTADGWVLPRGS